MNEYLRYLTQQMRYQEYREQAERDRLALQAQGRLGKHDSLYSRLLTRLGYEAIALGRELERFGRRLQEPYLSRQMTSQSLAKHAH